MMMLKIRLLILMMSVSVTGLGVADTALASPLPSIVVNDSTLECNQPSSRDYLKSCVAGVTYRLKHNANMDMAAVKVNCEIRITYLKSVMGIKNSARQHKNRTHQLLTNTSSQFEMRMNFRFPKQAEASNAEIESAHCHIDSVKQ